MTTILQRHLEAEMQTAYLDYTMSVIVGRALPDARDGLKPVHRRVLFAMHELGLAHNKQHRKSARVVGDVLGKYHPHGDSAVYETMVRMAQDFSLRYPLVDGQGNWGSVDGDSAAAMRYTEARLTKIAEELLSDIEKNTVAFTENFDGSVEEPVVLPSAFPNLLVNGSSGIAVGMATNIPPHNLTEICEAIIAVIENPQILLIKLIEIVKGPDFPTAGWIVGRSGIVEAYTSGRGKITVRGTVEVETVKDKNRLILTAIPYQTNKAQLIEQIADATRNKVLEGISDIRDESNKDGMRVVIELKRDASPEIVERNLYQATRLQQTYSMILLALVNNRPRVLGLRELIDVFIDHRRVVVTKRTQHELKKAEERQHILEGLLVALKNIDAVIALIKKSKEAKDARVALISNYSISEIQAQAILDLKLQRLTGLEQQSIKDEHATLAKAIANYKDILSHEHKVLSIVKEETLAIKEKYGDKRLTQIQENGEADFVTEDLIPDEQCVITVSHAGYVKRLPLDTYREQKRGGVGVMGASTKEEDWVVDVVLASTHDTLLLFTSTGKVHWAKAFELPEQSRTSMGRHIANIVQLAQGEKVQAIVSVRQFEEGYMVFATENGTIKKTSLSEFGRPRAGGIQAISLAENDALVNVIKTDGKDEILLISRRGLAVRCSEEDVRPMGRTATGVRGIKLAKDDAVVSLLLAKGNKTVLTMTENGYGKRTPLEDYRLIGRGGKGVITMNTKAVGPIVAASMASDEDGLITMSQQGTVLRINCSDVSLQGRATQGVRVMKLRSGDKLVSSTVVPSE